MYREYRDLTVNGAITQVTGGRVFKVPVRGEMEGGDDYGQRRKGEGVNNDKEIMVEKKDVKNG